LWVLGTIDDRVPVAPKWRLLAEGGAAAALVVAGLGWDTSLLGVGDFLLTVVWIVGVVNAFNLMDNLDGACGTVAMVSAAGVGLFATIKGQATIAGLAFALSGASAAFLHWNLARPARIFLGDGGSMVVGFLIAGLAMATARHASAGNAGVLVGALLVGVPILDTTLVSVSRWRRGVTLVTGGRDHLSHRLLLARRSPRSVAVTLALAQAALCSFAIAGYELGTEGVAAFAFGAFVAGVVAIFVLDTARWRPAGIAVGQEPEPIGGSAPEASSVGVDSG
jgi:UDP-GlcNAc:undecaprenyl-phosphate GlcNAc-1-phosphate transferase